MQGRGRRARAVACFCNGALQGSCEEDGLIKQRVDSEMLFLERREYFVFWWHFNNL
jgi:hypothetical protein